MSATHVQSTPTPWKTSVRHPEYMTSLPPSGAPDDDLSFHSTPALPTNPNWRCLCVWTAILEATASISHIILISHRIMQSHSIGKTKGRLMQIADCLYSVPLQGRNTCQNKTKQAKKKKNVMKELKWNMSCYVESQQPPSLVQAYLLKSLGELPRAVQHYQVLCSTTTSAVQRYQVLCSRLPVQ